MSSETEAARRPAKAPARQRAPKACQHCSQRKIKCDASLGYMPCSRCRMDGVDQCVLLASHRGTYSRKRRRLGDSPLPDAESRASRGPNHDTVSAGSIVGREGDAGGQATAGELIYTTAAATNQSLSSVEDDTVAVPAPQEQARGAFSNAGHAARTSNATDTASALSSSTLPDKSPNTQRPVESMFEEFLERNDNCTERDASKLGLVLYGESSPLTFALGGLKTGVRAHPQKSNRCFSSNSKLVRPHRRG